MRKNFGMIIIITGTHAVGQQLFLLLRKKYSNHVKKAMEIGYEQ
jgi:hypothetical protein